MSTALLQSNVVGNVYDKYGTKNPVARRLMKGFLRSVTGFCLEQEPKTVLEVGCGEGRLADHLVRAGVRPSSFLACDVELSKLADGLDVSIDFRVASAYQLPFEDKSFELVICCEVLEHLEDPELALSELTRVASRALVLSTPREPIWRALNVLRGRYLRELGNTPGHIQHFSSQRLVETVERHARILAKRQPLPWTVLLAEPRHLTTRS